MAMPRHRGLVQEFEITVTNTGPGDYNDKIVVEETSRRDDGSDET